MVTGPAIIPDMPIYRYDQFTNEEYYIVFPKETVERLAYDFISKGRVNEFTSQHLEKVEDVILYESWLKTSGSDKSVDLGYRLPIGTWFITCKINNENLWQQIKNGEAQGFSIEAFVGLEEQQFSKDMNNEEKMENFFNKVIETIKTALHSEETPTVEEEVIEETPATEEEVKLEEEVIVVEEPTVEEIVEDVVEEVIEETPNVE